MEQWRVVDCATPGPYDKPVERQAERADLTNSSAVGNAPAMYIQPEQAHQMTPTEVASVNSPSGTASIAATVDAIAPGIY